MSLLDTASLVVTPNGTKASKLYSVVPSDGAGDLDVTRATTATRVNSSGLIESVASNVPRLDYSNGSCPSILVEPQRTNLALRSEEFDNAAWTKFNGSVLANETIAPDGNNTADKVTIGGAGSTTLRQTISGVSNGTVVTFSLYIKQGSGVTAFLDISDTASIVNITPTANWTRYTYSVAYNSTNNFIDIELRGTSGVAYCYIWGAQLEVGSYATSYIPTTSASVTRNADVISKTGISSLIGQTEGTIFIDCSIDGVNSFNEALPISIFPSGGDINGNQAYIVFANNNKFIKFVYLSGAPNAIQTSNNFWSYGTRYKIAVVYKQNDFAMYINGNLIGTDTSGSVVSMSDLYFDYQNYAGKYDINLTALWKTRLTNSQLAELTTI